MATQEELEILVTSPTALATAAQLGQITRSFTDLDRALGGSGRGGGSGGNQYNFQINFNGDFNTFNNNISETTNNISNLNDGIKETSSSLNFFRTIFIAREFFRFGEWIADTSDQLSNLRNQVRTATDDIGGDAGKASSALLSMAQQTGTPIDKLSISFLRLTEASKGLGTNSSQVLRLTKSLAEATALAGRDPGQIDVGLQKLGKALEFGVNKGQELKAIFAEYPALGDSIATHFGVPVDKLKELAVQGKITGSEIFTAILEASDTLDARFAQLEQTFARAWVTFKTSALIAFEALGFPLEELAKKIAGLGDTMIQSAAFLLSFSHQLELILHNLQALIERIEAVAKSIAAAPSQNPITNANPYGYAVPPTAIEQKQQSKNFQTLQNDTLLPFVHLMTPAESMAETFRIYDNIKNQLTIALKDLDNKLSGGNGHTTAKERGKSWQEILKDEAAKEAVTAQGINSSTSGLAAEDAARQAKMAWADWRSEVDKLRPSLREQLGDLDQYIDGSKKLPAFAQQLKDIADKRAAETSEADRMKKINEALLKDDKARLDYTQKIQEAEEKADKARAQATQKQVTGVLNAPNIFGISGSKSINDQIRDLERLAKSPEAIGQALKDMGEDASRTDAVLKDINYQIELLKASLNPLATLFKGLTDNIVSGFAEAVAQSIVLHKNFGTLIIDLAKMIEMQAIAGFINKVILTPGINAIGGAIAGGGIQAAGAAGAVGLASGGYTGDYPTTQPVNVVHGQEYVLNARATAAIGRSNLDAMNNGNSGSLGPRITINNNAPGVVVTQGSVSRDEVQIMIQHGVAQHAPAAVAGAMNQPNSPVSKAMRNNIDANRRVL